MMCSAGRPRRGMTLVLSVTACLVGCHDADPEEGLRTDAGAKDGAAAPNRGARPLDSAVGDPRAPEGGSPEAGRGIDAVAPDGPVDAGARDALAASSDAAVVEGGDARVEGEAGTVTCDGPGARFITGVVEHAFGPGQNVGQALLPAPLLGPPLGGGCCEQSLDVVSLGNGGSIVVEFAGNAIVDGPGPDFIVFENAFFPGGNESAPFAELATVAVSDDGSTWFEFECVATAAPFGACAGWRPVFANPDSNAIDPLDPAVAGGDAFDLAELGLQQARYVKITDREDLSTGLNGVFDLDAVGIVNALCP